MKSLATDYTEWILCNLWMKIFPLRRGCATRCGSAGCVLIPGCDLFHCAAGAQFDSPLLHCYERITATGIDDVLVALVPG